MQYVHVHVLALCNALAGGRSSVALSERSPYPSCFECECVRDKEKWSPWLSGRHGRVVAITGFTVVNRDVANIKQCVGVASRRSLRKKLYSQTSLIRSSFIRIPRQPGENRWSPIYSICHAYIQYVCSIIRFPRLSGYFFVENGCVQLSEV